MSTRVTGLCPKAESYIPKFEGERVEPRACQPNIRIAPNRFTRPLLLVILHIPCISLTYLVRYVFRTHAIAQFKCAIELSVHGVHGLRLILSGFEMPGLLKCRVVPVCVFTHTCMYVNEVNQKVKRRHVKCHLIKHRNDQERLCKGQF